MNYPLISEYIDAILNAEDNFDTLRDLRPVLGEDGRPFMSSGNFAVVFKMTDGRNNYAIKCFTKEQEGREKNYRLITQELEYVNSKYLLNVEYIEDELFVDTQQSDKDTFPILKMQWAEGVTLDRYIKDHLSDDYALQMLAYEFSRMGMWLMNQDFAHGDLKPDNILVRNDGTLVLVDYDGMFVPAMQGQKAAELGTPDFRHPLRTAEQFDARIDDFSIAAIALSLKAIAAKPSLWADYHSQDRLLLGCSDYLAPGDSPLLREVLSLSNDATLSRLFGLFMIALSSQKLSLTSFRLLEVSKPERKKLEILPTEVSDEDIANGIEDEFGVVYSRDGKRLLTFINKENDIIQYDIKEGTVSICDNAFMYIIYFYKALESINIPNSVTSIGKTGFCGCESLKSIKIPNSVKSIGEAAFYCCKSLKSINIPNSVISIGNFAFYCCESLKSINIPNSVTSIGEAAFNCCKSLKLINIPNSVTSIGRDAFWCCKSLESIEIPNSVTSIGEAAFGNCKSLKSINIPNSVTSIGNLAFMGCESLESIKIPASVENIGDVLFTRCFQLSSIVVDKLNPVYDSRDCNIIVETKSNALICGCHKSVIPNSITSIGNGAFSHSKFLELINIPDSVTSIGESAFDDCESLKSINIPNSVKSIGEAAFYCCKSLESINIPDSVVNIGKAVLGNCSQLSSIIVDKLNPVYDSRGCNIIVETKSNTLICGCQKSIIPNSIMSIGDCAFRCCKSLKSINIPNSVTSIGYWAFENCESLESINIPNSVTSIGDSAFGGCKSLESINIPNSVTSIGDSAFGGCKSLESINIPNSVTSIGDSAFYGCKSLESINIPASVENIGKGVLNFCLQLSSIVVDKLNSVYDSRGCNIIVETISNTLIYGCKNSIIPNSVTSIGGLAFRNCESLKSINIPNSVTSIGDFAFGGCESLESINIPNSVTSIGDLAFYGCKSLESINIPIGTRSKFEKLLPYHKELLVEKHI